MEERLYVGVDLARPGSERTVIIKARQEGKALTLETIRKAVADMKAYAISDDDIDDIFEVRHPGIAPVPMIEEPPTEIGPPRNRKERRHQESLTRRRA